MTQSDDQWRTESHPSATGGGPEHGRPPYGDPGYGQQSAGAAPYGQQHPQPYGRPEGYGQEYGYHSAAAAPERPGGVVTAAVLGFVFGALGALVGIVTLVAGAAASTAGDDLDQQFPGFGSVSGFVGGALLVIGLLALLWTVVMIWGSVWALTGRSRVMLLVGGSIALAFTLIGLLGNLADSGNTGAGNIITSLLFFVGALAIVVLLSMKPAAQFYAAHRARRGR